MNDWDDYRFILALERSGTLRGAAAMLGVNHSTVSRKLAWLNKSQKQPLFERTRQGYQITDFGRHWLEAAEKIESLALSTQRRQRTEEDKRLSGNVSLSIALPIAEYLLSDLLSGFKARYPNITLTIDATEANVNLDRSEADIVVRSTHSPPEHLVGRRLFPYAVCYYAQRQYFHKTAEEDFNWIGSDSDDDFPDWVKQSPYPASPVTVRTTSYHMRYLALAAGLGLARGACFMADTNPDLMRLPGSEPFDTLDFWVLTHPDLRDLPRIKATMAFLVDALEQKRSQIQGQLED